MQGDPNNPFDGCEGEVESRDLVVAQTLVEVQTLLKEFVDAILEDLSTELPPMCNIQHHIDLIPCDGSHPRTHPDLEVEPDPRCGPLFESNSFFFFQ